LAQMGVTHAETCDLLKLEQGAVKLGENAQ
jgi:hypothetical protein